MTPQRFREIRRIFDAVVELAPEQRAAILDSTRNSDAELGKEVEALLAAYERRDRFIEKPAASLRTDPLEASRRDLAGSMVGAYLLVERVGEGGMGEVWRAEQQFPVRRIVAVKLIKPGMNTREVVARFESERQALALMDHPAIAKVFDAGSTPQGRPYFAMEYVDGVPITKYCDRHRLTIRDRIKLFTRVCEAVQHAHQKAIIHRDVKPSNILVAEVDGKPAPKIIDFGIARAVSQGLTGNTLVTSAGAILGTPDYMSPEQMISAGADIDTRTDVYSLGVVLYELLVGTRPFDSNPRGLHEWADAPQLSAKLRKSDSQATIAASRRTEPVSLARQLRGDLEAIGSKALERDRSRRYGSPSELAADIGRYLRNEPISARLPTVGYQALKYIRRHRTAVALASVSVSMLLLFGIGEAIQVRRITRERDRADRITKFMTTMFKVSDPSDSRGNKITAREILDRASIKIGAGLANDPATQADMMEVMGTVYYNLGLYSQAESLFDDTLRIRRVAGAGEVNTAQALYNLANALYMEGRFAEAENLDREALAIRQRLLGPEHPDTLRSMNNLARLAVKAGRYPEAEKLHRAVLEIRKRVLGPEDPDTLTSMDDLGETLDNEGRFGEAEALEREAFETERRVLGGDHPGTLTALHHLADTIHDQGRDQEAERLHREELAIYQRVLGPEHRDTLNAMLALANNLDNERRYSEAEVLVRQAPEIQRRVMGPEHPDTLLAMNNLAELLAEEGRYGEAERMHCSVIDLRRKVLGPEHAHTLYSLGRLGWTLVLERRFADAERIARETRQTQTRVLGPEHPDVADSTYTLACIAAQTGRAEQSLALLRAAAEHGLKAHALAGIETEPQFEPLRRDPRFRGLTARRTIHASR